MTSVTVDIGSPRSLVTFVTVDNKLPYVFVPIILLRHGCCTLVIILFGPFTRLFINPTMCIRALFSKSATTLGLVEQTFWRVPLITERIGANSFEVILAGASRHSTTGTLSSETSGSRCISLSLLHERIRRRIRLCDFSTLINIVAETAIVSSGTLPVGLPLPAISKNSLYTLFCLLILDHGVSFTVSISSAKILISYILLDTSFHHRFQYVIIKSYFLLMNLQVLQFQYGLEFLRLSYSFNLYNPSKMSSSGIFVRDNRIPSHF